MMFATPIITSEDSAAMRHFFKSKNLEYLKSNRPTGNVGKTLSEVRTRVKELPQVTESAPVNTLRPKLTIAFMNPTIGYGCFAGQKIEQGQIIGEYTGLLLSENSGRHDSHYAINLVPEEVRDKVGQSLCLSATNGGSELRFVNHLSPEVKVFYPDGRIETGPNAEVKRVWSNNQFHVYYVAKRLVKTGDEIRIHYHWSERQFPDGKASEKVYHLSNVLSPTT